ncbi:MAG: polyphosphate kinase 2 family protein [Aggregatilineales bacterium]
MAKQPLIPSEEKVHLKDYDPAYTGGFSDEQEVQEQLDKDLKRMFELQEIMYAGTSHALLIVLQAMDTGGKDGTITHVFRGLNPAGVQVASFKQPTAVDLAHDFLWRIHACTPPKGLIGVFNRSHYEDVLIVRVHELAPKKVWKKHYDQINDFEALLTENGTTILKFFLHISKDEQKRRLEDRLKQPDKHWKFNPDDLKERDCWDDYTEAYEAVFSKCNTKHAPWYIVPANHKWYRNYVVSQTIVKTLEDMNLEYPPAPPGLKKITVTD